MANWEAYLNEHQSQYLEELSDFLRIPSISSLPDHAEDIRRAAEWVAARLKQADIAILEHINGRNQLNETVNAAVVTASESQLFFKTGNRIAIGGKIGDHIRYGQPIVFPK